MTTHLIIELVRMDERHSIRRKLLTRRTLSARLPIHILHTIHRTSILRSQRKHNHFARLLMCKYLPDVRNAPIHIRTPCSPSSRVDLHVVCYGCAVFVFRSGGFYGLIIKNNSPDDSASTQHSVRISISRSLEL